jgi:hypothetical protein
MRYPPKRDRWAVWLLAVSVLVLFGIGAFLAMENLVFGVLFSVVAVSLLLSIYFGHMYEITSSHVVVRWGPVPVWWVRLDEIVEAVPTDSISATAHFAFSSDAIRIRSSKKIWGFLPPTLSISPQDKTSFLQALAAASPNLVRSNDGGLRRT